MKLFKFLVRILGLLGAFTLFAAGVTPAVIWTSLPVEPGEAVMVFGGPWGTKATVQLSGPDERTITPLNLTDDCLTFIYPEDWPQTAFTAKIVTEGGNVSIPVNAPDDWWVQGDVGRGSSPGGWLRIFGRSMGYSDEAFVEFRSKGKPIKVYVTEYDLYSLRVDLAADFPAGDYEAFVNNGLDKTSLAAGKVTVAPYKVPWLDQIFNVVDYGAIPNDRLDDTLEIRAALAALTLNGGGILYFPRGRFGYIGELALPPHTLLRGAGMALSQIYWPDVDYPTAPLLSGTHNFGVEEIFLVSGNFLAGIEATLPGADDTWKNENIILRKVRTRFLDSDAGSKDETARRLQIKVPMVKIEAGENVQILDCDFYTSKKGGAIIRPDYGLIRGNRFRGISCYIGGRQTIWEDNDCDGMGFSFKPGSRNYYFARNIFGNVRGDSDRETLTFDGGRTTHNGVVASVQDQGLTLPPGTWRDSPEAWIDETVTVIGGKGAGQMRTITKIDGRVVELDRPWDLLPDTNSLVVIGFAREKLLMVDNHLGDGNPFQFYGSVADAVLAGNRIESNSMHAFGMVKGGSPEPSWFIQFLGNEILDGNVVRGPWSFMVPAADSYIGFFDRGMKSLRPIYPLARVGIMRRNRLDGNAFLYGGPKVENLLVENNQISRSDKGVEVRSKGAIVRGNQFDDVIQPYIVTEDAVLNPAERIVGGLVAAKALLGDQVPEEWDGFMEEAEAIVKQSLPPAESVAATSGIVTRALVSLSAAVGDGAVPGSLITSLTGLDLSQSSSGFLVRIASGTLTQGQFPLGVRYAAWAPPAVLIAQAGDLGGGWTSSVLLPKSLVPGESATIKLALSRPDTQPTVFTLPVAYELSGDGWTFRFTETYGYRELPISDLLVAGPFKNRSGKNIDTEVHPPEINLDVTHSYETLDGTRSWVAPEPDEKGRVDLTTVFETTDVTTAHAVAILRATKPIRVNVNYGRNFYTICMVNGKPIGSSARRPGPATVALQPGDNVFHIISSHSSGKWMLPLEVDVIDTLKPYDLQVVSSSELKTSPRLVAPGGKVPEGQELLHSQGVDWKLFHHDSFDRPRLGSDWVGRSQGRRAQMAEIQDGAMRSQVGWGFITFDREVSSPVRIEFDMMFGDNMAGVYLCPKGLGFYSFWRKLVGRGYLFSLGWHDAKNNRIMRDTETVLLDELSPQLTVGQTYRITAQFIPPRCEIYIDGELVMAYEDPEFLPGLDRIGLFQIGSTTFDNVRIYTAD